MEFKGVGIANTEDGKIEGVGSFQGGIYKNLKIDGVCTINGDIEAESIKVNGVCTCNGNIIAKSFDCDGVLTVEGNLRAGKIDVDGVVTVNGNKIEADRIDCDGVLSTVGEINADYIKADGRLNAEEIVGDHIIIKSYWSNGGKKLLLLLGEKITEKWNSKMSVIGLIEGTTVELRGVRAKSVNGQNVNIGKNCDIGIVDASGELFIHPTSTIAQVVN